MKRSTGISSAAAPCLVDGARSTSRSVTMPQSAGTRPLALRQHKARKFSPHHARNSGAEGGVGCDELWRRPHDVADTMTIRIGIDPWFGDPFVSRTRRRERARSSRRDGADRGWRSVRGRPSPPRPRSECRARAISAAAPGICARRSMRRPRRNVAHPSQHSARPTGFRACSPQDSARRLRQGAGYRVRAGARSRHPARSHSLFRMARSNPILCPITTLSPANCRKSGHIREKIGASFTCASSIP